MISKEEKIKENLTFLFLLFETKRYFAFVCILEYKTDAKQMKEKRGLKNIEREVKVV